MRITAIVTSAIFLIWFTNDEITERIIYCMEKIGAGMAVGAISFLFVMVAIMIIREE